MYACVVVVWRLVIWTVVNFFFFFFWAVTRLALVTDAWVGVVS